MNALGTLPFVDDLIIEYMENGKKIEEVAYGPYAAKLVRIYPQQEEVGKYSQRNGELTTCCFGITIRCTR